MSASLRRIWTVGWLRADLAWKQTAFHKESRLIAEEWICSAESERWTAALKDVPHSYWHSAGPCHAAAVNTGHAVSLLVLRDNDATLACPVMLRPWRDSFDFATPIGFSGIAVTRTPCATDLLSRWSVSLASRGANAAYLAQHPLFGPDLLQPGDSLGSALFVIDLSEPLENWLCRIDQNRRRAIRAWRRQGSPWVRDRQRLADFLVEHHASAMRAFNASPGSYLSAEALRLLCADVSVELVGAADELGICSVAVFGASPWGAELVFHISTRAGKRFSTALMWWAVQYYHGKLPLLNLGGTPAEDDALAEAKRRYRPREIRYVKLKRILDAGKYTRLCWEAGVPLEGEATYFPAYRLSASAASGATNHVEQASTAGQRNGRE